MFLTRHFDNQPSAGRICRHVVVLYRSDIDVDDVAIIEATRAKVTATLIAVRALLSWVGLVEADEKFEGMDDGPVGTHSLSWLGLDVDMRPGHLCVRYPSDKRTYLLETINEFLQTYRVGDAVPLRDLIGAAILARENSWENRHIQ